MSLVCNPVPIFPLRTPFIAPLELNTRGYITIIQGRKKIRDLKETNRLPASKPPKPKSRAAKDSLNSIRFLNDPAIFISDFFILYR